MRLHSFITKHLPLTHAKTVLFVGNDQGQLVIDHFLLYQGMCPYNNVCLMVCNRFVGQPLFFGCHGTGQKDRSGRQPKARKQLIHRFKMLSGQNLRRNH